jgi:hypothetical protein
VSGIMIGFLIAAVSEGFLGVDTEQESLEDIAEPLSAEAGEGS